MPLPPRKTCKRYNTPGHTHFLTFSCFKRRPFLSKDGSRRWFIEAVNRAKDLHNFFLFAWVIMPEHAHLLIHPRGDDYSIAAILTSIKKPTTNAALRHVRAYAPGFAKYMEHISSRGEITLRFWQRGGGYDTNLWTPKFIHEKIAYIHNNPVERRLVARAEDWPWSSAQDFAKRRPVPLLPLDLAHIPW